MEGVNAVLYYAEVRVANPSIDQPLVKIDCFLQRFVPSLIALCVVMAFSAISSGDEMDHSFVPSVSELDGTPACFIQDGLPYVVVGVGAPIHYASIAKHDGWLVAGLGDLNKDILKVHLQLHQVDLKLDCIAEDHFWCLDQSTSDHQDGGCFWNNQNAVTDLLQVQLQGRKCCGLTRTGTSRHADPRDWIF